MKIKLLKPLQVQTIEKPVGKIMDVTREYGNLLISEGVAEPFPFEQKTNKDKKQKPTNK